MCRFTDWFTRAFQREEEVVEGFMMKHRIGDKEYGVPDSTMVGKIVINMKGEPEIRYFKKEVLNETN